MKNKITTGEQIKQIRLLKGKTMREFASECGLTAAAINLLEHNKVKKPTMDTLSALSKGLDKSLYEVCQMYGIEIEKTPKESLTEALRRYGLDISDVKSAINYINFLKAQHKEKTRQEHYL